MKIVNDELIPLIAGITYGNERDFNNLYKKTSARLFALSIKVVKRRDWAEEVLQDAFIKIWHQASDYHSGKGSVFNWMVTIVRYRAIDYLRSHGNQAMNVVGIEELDEQCQDITTDLSLGRDVMAIDKCMKQLTIEQRNSIVLAFFYGLTHDELAEKSKRPVGTIKSWVRRGLMDLKRCLGYEK